jgi:ribosomal protein L22
METSKSVAATLGMTPRNVRNLAAKLRIEKMGRDYVFTVRDVIRIKRSIPAGKKRGRPAITQE